MDWWARFLLIFLIFFLAHCVVGLVRLCWRKWRTRNVMPPPHLGYSAGYGKKRRPF